MSTCTNSSVERKGDGAELGYSKMSKGGEELTSEEKYKYATPKLSTQGKYLMHILKSNLMQNKS